MFYKAFNRLMCCIYKHRFLKSTVPLWKPNQIISIKNANIRINSSEAICFLTNKILFYKRYFNDHWWCIGNSSLYSFCFVLLRFLSLSLSIYLSCHSNHVVSMDPSVYNVYTFRCKRKQDEDS